MTQFKLKIANEIEFPIHLEVQNGRVKSIFNFFLTGKRLNVEEWKRYFGPTAENNHLTTGDFLREHILGWRGQNLVLNENDQPADFSPDAFDALLTLVGAEMILFMAYQKAIFASDGDAGRRKNSPS